MTFGKLGVKSSIPIIYILIIETDIYFEMTWKEPFFCAVISKVVL